MILRRLIAISLKRDPINGAALGLIVGGQQQSAGQVAAVSYLVAAYIAVALQQRGKQS